MYFAILFKIICIALLTQPPLWLIKANISVTGQSHFLVNLILRQLLIIKILYPFQQIFLMKKLAYFNTYSVLSAGRKPTTGTKLGTLDEVSHMFAQI